MLDPLRRRGRADPTPRPWFRPLSPRARTDGRTSLEGAMAKTRRKRRLEVAPVEIGAEAALKLYRDMLLIRRFEEKAGQMYGMGLIGGFCHLYIGQEAVVVGMQAAF